MQERKTIHSHHSRTRLHHGQTVASFTSALSESVVGCFGLFLLLFLLVLELCEHLSVLLSVLQLDPVLFWGEQHTVGQQVSRLGVPLCEVSETVGQVVTEERSPSHTMEHFQFVLVVLFQV